MSTANLRTAKSNPPGTRVRISGGSGIDSDKTGTVVRHPSGRITEYPFAGGRGHLLRTWRTVILDDGGETVMPTERLTPIRRAEGGEANGSQQHDPGGGAALIVVGVVGIAVGAYLLTRKKTPVCKAPTVYDKASNTCRPPTVPPGLTCPTGWVVSGSTCACPPGQHQSGQSCVNAFNVGDVVQESKANQAVYVIVDAGGGKIGKVGFLDFYDYVECGFSDQPLQHLDATRSALLDGVPTLGWAKAPHSTTPGTTVGCPAGAKGAPRCTLPVGTLWQEQGSGQAVWVIVDLGGGQCGKAYFYTWQDWVACGGGDTSLVHFNADPGTLDHIPNVGRAVPSGVIDPNAYGVICPPMHR